ncbi:MotA/TolQ/ExbB proton channel family protein [uncultured Tateyamaria sp.]|uniref:MotA/TolQ/ExbB proton channel family protein n=1 Tax=uncultured Tateyamaria sp. TaxID=455651 RepID=UPI0026375A98|nr:MotA/TolQ/ExbB proton channel family protein [uncultured Tateyamaria sp.]
MVTTEIEPDVSDVGVDSANFLMSTKPQALALLAFGILSFFSLRAAHAAELLPTFISTYIEDDALGILLMQGAGFIAFLILCFAQYVLSLGEEASLRAERAAMPLLFRAAGHSDGWIAALDGRVVAPPGEALETVLGQHEDARLALLRILLAAFPTAGFIGTVLGIMQAIAPLGVLAGEGVSQAEMSAGMSEVIDGLELAFSTTLVGLVLLLAGSFILGLVALAMRASHTRTSLKWRG